jgi:hypothetical protein
VQVLDGRDPRLEHLEGGVERVEVRIDVPGRHTAREPQFERMIGRAELQGREADVVMAVDEAGHDHVLGRAQHLVGTVAGLELSVRPHFHHHAIALEHRAIGDDTSRRPALDPDDYVLATDQRRRHAHPPRPRVT